MATAERADRPAVFIIDNKSGVSSTNIAIPVRRETRVPTATRFLLGSASRAAINQTFTTT